MDLTPDTHTLIPIGSAWTGTVWMTYYASMLTGEVWISSAAMPDDHDAPAMRIATEETFAAAERNATRALARHRAARAEDTRHRSLLTRDGLDRMLDDCEETLHWQYPDAEIVEDRPVEANIARQALAAMLG